MNGGPVREGERAEILDVLRGVALLGIFLAHVPGISGWDYLTPAEQALLDPGSDGALQFARDVFVRGKFYSLFSLLFGFGFAIQQASAARQGQGAGFSRRFLRRQTGLLAIGVAHSALWHGDILLTYALLGMAIIPFAQTPPRRVFAWAVGLLVVRGVWGVGTFLLAGALASVGDSAVGDGGGGVDVDGTVSAVMAGYYSPSWGEMLLANARFLRLKWLLVLYEGRLFSIAGFFLLGVAFGKWQVHQRVGSLGVWLRRVAWIGGGVGVAGNLALAMLWPIVPTYPPTVLGVVTNAIYAVAVPSLALAMAAGIAWLWVAGRGRALLSWFAPPGRMALTTYLTQTAIGLGVFYGVGLGYRGTLSLTEGLVFALVVFSLQALAARAWLASFAYGPVEWAWRCATYGRALRLRRQPAR